MSTVKSTDVKDNFKEYKVIQKEKTFSTKKERNSGIELLKIIAIVLIVISHVVYTLKTVNPYISDEVHRRQRSSGLMLSCLL